MNQIEEDLINTEELAEKLKISRQTILRWKKDGMPLIQLSESIVRFRMSEVIQWRSEVMAAKQKKRGEAK